MIFKLITSLFEIETSVLKMFITFLCFNRTFYNVRFILKAEVYSSFLQVIMSLHWKDSSGLIAVYI